MYCFLDKARYWSKMAILYTSPALAVFIRNTNVTYIQTDGPMLHHGIDRAMHSVVRQNTVTAVIVKLAESTLQTHC